MIWGNHILYYVISVSRCRLIFLYKRFISLSVAGLCLCTAFSQFHHRDPIKLRSELWSMATLWSFSFSRRWIAGLLVFFGSIIIFRLMESNSYFSKIIVDVFPSWLVVLTHTFWWLKRQNMFFYILPLITVKIKHIVIYHDLLLILSCIFPILRFAKDLHAFFSCTLDL